jgi:hypothetical protein
MRIKNVWFDLLTFFGAVFWIVCAVGAILDYNRGHHAGLMVTALTFITFLLLALLCFRASLQFGDYQRRVCEKRTPTNDERQRPATPDPLR